MAKKEQLQSTTSARMIPEKRLLEHHIQHGITAILTFDKSPKIGDPSIRLKLLEKLQEDINVGRADDELH